jgi:putative phosphoribosyl transferase
MGALGEGGVEVVDRDLLWRAGVSAHEVAAVVRAERAALCAREELLREHRPGLGYAGRPVVIVDDGIATGATARVACLVARARGASRVVVAAPVVLGSCTAHELGADELVFVEAGRHLYAVGQAYEDFSPVSDRECARLLAAGPTATGRAGMDDLASAGRAAGSRGGMT